MPAAATKSREREREGGGSAPSPVVATAVALSRLHALTEELDHVMASYCVLHAISASRIDAYAYLAAWHFVGRRAERQQQLNDVLVMGEELAVLTTKPGLALLLKLMRRPANSAGLGSLQRFLESGFTIFASLSRSKGKVQAFLSTVQRRESAWLEAMFDNPIPMEAAALALLID